MPAPTTTQPQNHTPNRDVDNNPDLDDDDDDDALFATLENETENDQTYRTHRLEQLNAEFQHYQSQSQSQSKNNPQHHQPTPLTTTTENTPYPTLPTDAALLSFTTNTHRCVIHFAHPDFSRCAVMDAHLQNLAYRHHEVRFARADVRGIPFVVEKLGIKVLPYVIGFREGVAVERVVGFEGLGVGVGGGSGRGKKLLTDGADQFDPVALERRLLGKGVLVRARLVSGGGGGGGESGSDEENSEDEEEYERLRGGRRGIRGPATRRVNDGDDDDDDDWE